jgi:DNA-binding CsgD family transcriptional regulator
VSARRDELVAEGWDAVKRGDGAAARPLFEAALGETDTGSVLEGAGKAAYLERDYTAAIAYLERAYAAYRGAADGLGAVRVARMLSYMNGSIVGDRAVMQGWNARANTLLHDAGDTAERGWVSLNSGLFEGDRTVRERCFTQAAEVAKQFDDDNLLFNALAYLGATLVHDDRVEEGMVLLDEACAAVAGGEVDDIQALQEIFCQLFSACEYAHDVERADQWIRIGEEIAARRNLPAVSAFCQTHYGGLLTEAGRWDEAETTLSDAVRMWDLGHRGLRGGALVRLADLRVRQGRLEEAEQLLEGMELDPEAARPLAALHLARGEVGAAAGVVERAVMEMDASTAAAGPLWSLLADVELERGDVRAAAQAVERLAEVARLHGSRYLMAASALARGRLCLASGSGDPRACLNEALSGFAKARLPLELGRARFELARSLVDEHPDDAVAEAKAALDAFERLEAARHADEAAALLRSLGAPVRVGSKGRDALTKREAEVLELLGHGLSNPEISDRLFISRKTVEHHVGNVLAKLGLRGRAEAAAFAARASERPARK